MRHLLKRWLARLRCRLHGHQLHFVRINAHHERLFFCHCCKERFTLCDQRWQRDTDSSLQHDH